MQNCLGCSFQIFLPAEGLMFMFLSVLGHNFSHLIALGPFKYEVLCPLLGLVNEVRYPPKAVKMRYRVQSR